MNIPYPATGYSIKKKRASSLESKLSVSFLVSFSDSVGIRTQDPQLRRLLLYPAELRNRALSQTNKATPLLCIILKEREKGTRSFFTLIQKNQVSDSLLCRGVARKDEVQPDLFAAAKLAHYFYISNPFPAFLNSYMNLCFYGRWYVRITNYYARWMNNVSQITCIFVIGQTN